MGILLSLILPAPSMKQLIQDECLKVAGTMSLEGLALALYNGDLTLRLVF